MQGLQVVSLMMGRRNSTGSSLLVNVTPHVVSVLSPAGHTAALPEKTRAGYSLSDSFSQPDLHWGTQGTAQPPHHIYYFLAYHPEVSGRVPPLFGLGSHEEPQHR